MSYESNLIETYHQAKQRLNKVPQIVSKPFHHPQPFDHETIEIWIPSLAYIIRMVSLHEQISIVDLRSDRRDKPTSDARLMVYYLARYHTTLSTPVIGYHLGGRDHSTVVYGAKRIGAKRLTDYKLDQKLKMYEKILLERPKASV